MESTRQKKFARQMQRELSVILQQQVEKELGAMITLSHVRTTPDLSIVRCYITTMPENKLPHVLKRLNEESWKVRQALAKEVRHVVKQIPELEFYEDDVLKTAERLDDLFEKIHSEEAQRPTPPEENAARHPTEED